MNFDYEARTLCATVAGSHLYGTVTPDSDEDIRGVIVPPRTYWFGLDSFEQFEPPEEDTVFHELRKFLRLSAAGNPAFLEMWWAPPANRRQFDFWWEKLKKDLWRCVLSKNLVKPHLGMAQAHLARITKPGRNCGEKGRKAIEEFGYNTKDASHVVRVLHQAQELLMTGRLLFPRLEARMLLDIKRGKYTLKDIYKMEELLVADVRRAVESPESIAPGPDLESVNNWLCEYLPSILRDFDEREPS